MKELSLNVFCGNNIELLKQYPDNHFDSVVTDAPYGLGKEPNANEMLQAWVTDGYLEVKGSGFMGKDWDAFVPQPLFWKEVFRVLKHGGHVLSFFGTRTYDWGVMAMRLAGFEVRDCIFWTYGSGFPKSYNIAKGIEGKIINGSSSWNDWKKLDGEKEQVNWGYSKGQAEQGYRGDYTEANKERIGKVNFQSDEAKEWDGWGSALKPAVEPIVLARKPLEKGLSIAENVLKWGTGGINIDGCRVGLSKNDDKRLGGNGSWKTDKAAKNIYEGGYEGKEIESSTLGRFPANIILTHHPECICNGLKKVKGVTGGKNDIIVDSKFGQVSNIAQKPFDYADENGEETIEDWTCHEDCPIRVMDEQSGESKSNNTKRNRNSIGSFGMPNDNTPEYNDKGGASRFFYCAKASKSERNKGLDGFEEKQTFTTETKGKRYIEDVNCADGKYQAAKAPNKNFHPTVKPVKLMQYLVRLVTPPNGIVLDPFCGSGTTGIACKLEGFNFVGMDITEEYCEIAKARIQNFVEEKETYKKQIETEQTEETKNQLNLFEND